MGQRERALLPLLIPSLLLPKHRLEAVRAVVDQVVLVVVAVVSLEGVLHAEGDLDRGVGPQGQG